MQQPPHNPSKYTPGERLALLSRLAQEFNASLDPDDVLNRVIDEVILATGGERGFSILLDPPLYLNKDQSDQSLTLVAHTARGIEQNAINAPEFQVSRTIVEQVARLGQPVLTSDALKDARFQDRESVTHLKLRSVICAPMKILSRVIGVVYVDNRIQAGQFTQQDLELLTSIAAAAAIAIENARLFKNVQGSLGRLRLLHKISQELTATLELESVLARSVQSVQELLGASAASILQIEGEELVFKIALGEKANQVKPFRIPHGQGIAGWVVEHMEPQIVNDVHHDNRFFRGTDDQSGFITQSLAAAPLVINDKPVGVLEVFNKPGGFTQGDLDLLVTFASAAAIALENARLYAEAVEKGRMERELQMARKVQTSLLPQATPSLPGWEFAARWLPAREVGGDYYDFVPLVKSSGQHERLGVVIADVADKGTPAALFMASARSIVRASAYDAQSPLHAMQHANVLISADSQASMFITMFYGQLDIQTGELTYINAGHNPPLLCQCGSASQSVVTGPLRTSGPPIGIGPQTAYSQHCASLNPGDFLLCYTDGVTDALSPDDEFFGLERLKEVASSQFNRTAVEILAALEDSLHSFMGGRERFDDITILIIRRNLTVS